MKNLIILTFITFCSIEISNAQDYVVYPFLNEVLLEERYNDFVVILDKFSFNHYSNVNFNESYFRQNWYGGELATFKAPNIEYFLDNWDVSNLNNDIQINMQYLDIKRDMLSSFIIPIKESSLEKDTLTLARTKGRYKIISKPIFNFHRSMAIIFQANCNNNIKAPYEVYLQIYLKFADKWVPFHRITLLI